MSDNLTISITGLTPFLVAVTICAPLWAVTIAQASAYYRTYPKDRAFLKYLVGFCVILSTAQLATIAYMVYFWMIICRTPPNYAFLGALKNLIVVPAYITYFLTTVVQCFYAMRVWFVSGKKVLLVVIIVILAITQLGGGFALVSYMVTIDSIIAVYSRFNHISGSIELGSSMLCDIIISTSLVIYLRESRTNVFRKTRHAVDRLVLYSVNIGLLTNIMAMANLVTWLAAPESDFTWAIFHFSLGKVYVNSMLVSLNARHKIRQELRAGQYVSPTSMFDVDGITTRRGGEVQMVNMSNA
ncbi:hypothetical protein EDD18DRAFT_848518 [Armillaria luteobubalina]|uniref:DUF6534 domain-containing protein n=1 Tax=Armillaria luteobubalina TaxID=153913 RepID=A0AA39UVI3_9AGAR|nr:hypothetical protein EDD18DRAFT_848518 [Armillaria luteobubalina]